MRTLLDNEITQLKKIWEGSGIVRFSDFLDFDLDQYFIEISTFQQKLLVYTAVERKEALDNLNHRFISAMNLVRTLERAGYLTSWYKASLAEDEVDLGKENIKNKNPNPYYVDDLSLATEILKLQSHQYKLHPQITSLILNDEIPDENNAKVDESINQKSNKVSWIGFLLVILSVGVCYFLISYELGIQSNALESRVDEQSEMFVNTLDKRTEAINKNLDRIHMTVENIEKKQELGDKQRLDHAISLSRLLREQRILQKQLSNASQSIDSLIVLYKKKDDSLKISP